jgi:hypothetical protein
MSVQAGVVPPTTLGILLVGFCGVQVDAGNLKSGLGKLHGQGQAYIAKPDDSHARLTRLYFFCESTCDRFSGRGHVLIIQSNAFSQNLRTGEYVNINE